MINPIEKIVTECTGNQFNSHLTIGGQLYIPRDLGSVKVTMSGIDDNGAYIKLMPDERDTVYKKNITVGKALVRKVFDAYPANQGTTFPITFNRMGKRGWFARIPLKKGR